MAVDTINAMSAGKSRDPNSGRPPGEVTAALRGLQDQPNALNDRLFSLLYDELRRLAAAKLRRESNAATIQPTVLIHEAWLRLRGRDEPWASREEFLGCAAVAMRRILIENARRKNAKQRVPVLDYRGAQPFSNEDLVILDDILTKIGEIHPVGVKLIELTYFAGLTIVEAARILGIGKTGAQEQLRSAKALIHSQSKMRSNREGVA